jgi:hypothetical protein
MDEIVPFGSLPTGAVGQRHGNRISQEQPAAESMT